MRTITEIKESICVEFMRNEHAAKAYGFTRGDSFSAHFSITSVESVLFYVFACAAWVLEGLFDTFSTEVDTRIQAMIPHRPKWYRDKMLAFMKGKTLIADTDSYDTTGMSDSEIDTAHVVKHAVAVESEDSSLLTIKVAGESGGVRGKLDDDVEIQLKAYIAEIKDAGVRTTLINEDPDSYICEVDVYYDPLLLPGDVETGCRAAIQSYIENLPFNGEYTNMALVDALQVVSGVRIVEFKGAKTSSDGGKTTPDIDARHVPFAGYYKYEAEAITLNMKPYGA